MYRIIIIFFMAFNVFSAFSVSAKTSLVCYVTPYIGIDTMMRHMGYKDGLGNNLFKHELPQVNGYIGLRINDFFGIEFGYKQTDKKSKIASVGVNDFELGVLNDSGFLTTSHNTTQLKGPYLNLVGFYPICDLPFEIFGSIGLADVHLKLKYSPIAIGNSRFPFDMVDEARRDFEHHRTILQLATGIQYRFCDRFGIRAQVGFEHTARFKYLMVNKQTEGTILRASLRNSSVFGLGFFVEL